MTALFIVDLDGVVADSTERFKKATRADGSIDWKIAFDPVNVPLDTLIDGAVEAIDALRRKEHVVFLTSRLEPMREATETWLSLHGLEGIELFMKPLEKRFTRTVQWKRDEVAHLKAASAGASVVFIDDEASNREAVEALGVICFASLADCVSEEPLIF